MFIYCYAHAVYHYTYAIKYTYVYLRDCLYISLHIFARYSIPSVLPHGSAVCVYFRLIFSLIPSCLWPYLSYTYWYYIAYSCIYTYYILYIRILCSFGTWCLMPWLVCAVYLAQLHRLVYIIQLIYIDYVLLYPVSTLSIYVLYFIDYSILFIADISPNTDLTLPLPRL